MTAVSRARRTEAPPRLDSEVRCECLSGNLGNRHPSPCGFMTEPRIDIVRELYGRAFHDMSAYHETHEGSGATYHISGRLIVAA